MRMATWAIVMTLAGASIAYAGWWGWGEQTDVTKDGAGTPIATQSAAVAVKVPVGVSGTLPPGHPLNVQAFDRVMGQADAPVTMIEYASLTCSHCAEFHTTTLQQVKVEWVDTGKVKYVLRDLPWDNLALGMAKISRCADPAMFYPLVGAFFEAQKDIMTGVDTLGEIKQVARMAGLDGAKVDACIADAPLQALIVGVKENGLSQLRITGTPTSFINGVRVDGAQPYKDVKPVLEAAYAAAMVAKAEEVKQAVPAAPQAQ